MAHVAKYKAHSVGHMLAHYRRDPSCFERDNINTDFLGEDFTLMCNKNPDGTVRVERPAAMMQPNWDVVKSRREWVDRVQRAAGKRATRSDAVVMADMVLTAPEDLKAGDEFRFFALSYAWLAQRMGVDNMLGCFVHADEMRTKKLDDGTVVQTGERIRTHAHMPWTPILDGKFNFKKQCPRSFYQSIHKDLNAYVDKALGYHVSIGLDEETRAKRVYADKSKDIDAVRAAVEKETAEAHAQLDAVMREVRAAVKAKEDAEAARDRAVAQKVEVDAAVTEATERLESVQGETQDLEFECCRLENACADARGAVRVEFAKAAERAPKALYAFLQQHEGTWAGNVLKALVEGFEGIKQCLARGAELLKPTSWRNRSKMQAEAAREAASKTVVPQKQVLQPDLRKHPKL